MNLYISVLLVSFKSSWNDEDFWNICGIYM